MTFSRSVFLSLGVLILTACEAYTPTPRPDYSILVDPSAGVSVATPPACPGWNDSLASSFDNQLLPQFGCANARNLASAVENPDDLVEGRDLKDGRGVTAVGAIRRYDNNQPRGLIMPVSEDSQTATTTAPVGASSMTGDVTGGTASSPAGGASAPTP
jgi:hypothetical protein